MTTFDANSLLGEGREEDDTESNDPRVAAEADYLRALGSDGLRALGLTALATANVAIEDGDTDAALQTLLQASAHFLAAIATKQAQQQG